MVKGLAIAALALLVLIQSVSAVVISDSQKNITITLEHGKEYSFNLLLKNVTTRIDIASEGNASAWITYGDAFTATYTITNLIDQTLKVTVFIPSSASTGSYITYIKGNNETLSNLSIKVISAITESFQGLQNQVSGFQSSVSSDIDTIQAQQSSMGSRLNELKVSQDDIARRTGNLEDLAKNMDKKLNSIQSFEEDLKQWRQADQKESEQMQATLQNMENRTNYLEQKNKELTDLTGALSLQGASLTLLLIIIVAGILFYFFASVSRKNRVVRALSGGGREHEARRESHSERSERQKEEAGPSRISGFPSPPPAGEREMFRYRPK